MMFKGCQENDVSVSRMFVYLRVLYLSLQLCCFLVGIYVCVHLFDCQNKSTFFQKLKSSNVFCARARPSAGASREAASMIYINVTLSYAVTYCLYCTRSMIDILCN